MSISTELKRLLDSSGVTYEHRTHGTTYTAAATAESVHIPREEMAKTVVINADGLLRLAVIPAGKMVDLTHLRFVTRSANMRLATEAELKEAFPTCEVGAMPPFALDLGLPVFCDTRLEDHKFIEFNAGTHTDTIRMAFSDFKKLANPTFVDLVDHKSKPAA